MDTLGGRVLVARAVRAAMEDRRISAQGLSDSTGIPPRTLAERLSVRSAFTVAELQLIAGVLDTRASSLLDTPAGPTRTAADDLD